jgi:hypothetical protein
VRLVGHGAEGYGAATGTPLREAAIEAGEVPEPADRELWRLTGRIDVDGEGVDYDQRLTLTADGSYLVHAGGGALCADPASGTVRVRPTYEALERQLVTTFGLPLLLHGTPSLLLHACAAVGPGSHAAHVICAASGTGKSTLLAALIAAGWRALAEDIAVVDLRPDEPVVWPGPPWLRLRGPGPRDAKPRFHARDKTAWDVAPWHEDHAIPIARLVFLEMPAGSGAEHLVVPMQDSVARLASAALWLADPRDKAAATFGPVVRIARVAPATSLRLPHSLSSVASAAEILSEA